MLNPISLSFFTKSLINTTPAEKVQKMILRQTGELLVIVDWHIYASLGLDELTHLKWMHIYIEKEMQFLWRVSSQVILMTFLWLPASEFVVLTIWGTASDEKFSQNGKIPVSV